MSTEYQYDGASRVIALLYRNTLGPLGDLTYGYDAGGNRIATGGSFARTLVPDAVSTSTYDAGNRQLAFGPSTMSFDDNGNLLTRTDGSGTTTSTWDARNRLTLLSGPGLTAGFAYDGLGRRAQKTINSAVTAFLYDGLDVVTERSGGTDVEYLRTLNIDEGLVRTDPVDMVHTLADALGSSVALATAGGTLTTTYSYAPFGQTETTGTPNPNPFRFTGREEDSTGLYYYRARYYDPGRSRFVGEDPLGLGGGVNGFTYVAGNPLGWVDPEGLQLAPPLGVNPGVAGAWGGGAGVGALPPLQPLTSGQWEQMKEDLGRWLDPWPLVDYVNDLVTAPARMAAPGNVGDTQIEADWAEAQSAAKLGGCPPPDRCKWLAEQAKAGKYSPARIKAQEKKWGCRRSRAGR